MVLERQASELNAARALAKIDLVEHDFLEPGALAFEQMTDGFWQFLEHGGAGGALASYGVVPGVSRGNATAGSAGDDVPSGLTAGFAGSVRTRLWCFSSVGSV